MQVICNTQDFQIPGRTAVTFGKFDGIHRGHQRLLDALLEKKKQGLKTVVFTFFTPPVYLSAADQSGDIRQLTPNEEKKRFLEAYGIDYLVEYPFTDEVRQTPPEQFVREVIRGKLQAAFVAAGPDFGFGYRRKGNVLLLASMAQECGYELQVFDKVIYGGSEISSSRVRQTLEKGWMEQAADMLGRPYALKGTVIHGRSLGHTIGFATMNLVWPSDKFLVPVGVYFSQVFIRNKRYPGITNIGYRPTVEKDSSKSDLLLEVHLLQYNQMAYGEEIEVFLFHYERPEIRFSGLELLREQLRQDERACEAYFAER